MNEVRPQRLMVTPALSHYGEGESHGSTMHLAESDSQCDAKRARLRGLSEDRGYMGTPEALPELWSVGCCDSSKNRHATKHYHHTRHPIIQSFESGESWRWYEHSDRQIFLAHVVDATNSDTMSVVVAQYRKGETNE